MIIEFNAGSAYQHQRFYAVGMSWNYSVNAGGAGPWCVEAGQVFVPGAKAGMAFVPGAEVGGVFMPGAKAGQAGCE